MTRRPSSATLKAESGPGEVMKARLRWTPSRWQMAATVGGVNAAWTRTRSIVSVGKASLRRSETVKADAGSLEDPADGL